METNQIQADLLLECDEVEGYGQFIGQFQMTAPIPHRPAFPGDSTVSMVSYQQARAWWASHDPYYPPLH